MNLSVKRKHPKMVTVKVHCMQANCTRSASRPLSKTSEKYKRCVMRTLGVVGCSPHICSLWMLPFRMYAFRFIVTFHICTLYNSNCLITNQAECLCAGLWQNKRILMSPLNFELSILFMKFSFAWDRHLHPFKWSLCCDALKHAHAISRSIP